MEIQLVSKDRLSTDPNDTACRFTKFFDEDITIPANSKINLNSATFERFEGAYIDETETLSVIIDSTDTLGGAPSSTYSVSFPRGTYTNSQIQSKFEEVLQDVIDGSSTATSLKVQSDVYDDELRVGFVPEDYPSEPITSSVFSSAGISVGCAFDDPLDSVYASSGTSQWVTSFYVHDFDQPILQTYEDSDYDELPGSVYIFNDISGGGPLTSQDLIDKSGAGTSAQVFGGFYSSTYADDDTVGTGTRTNSTAIAYVDVGRSPVSDYTLTVPTSFFSFMLRRGVDGSGTDTVFLDTYVASNNTQGKIMDWDNMKYSIDSMELVTSSDLRIDIKEVDLNTVLYFKLTLYRNFVSQTDDERNYFYPYIQMANSASEDITVFDGRDYDIYFSKDFLTGLGYGTAAFKSSQLLQSFFSTNIQNVGTAIVTDALPAASSNFLRYKFTMGPQVAKSLGVYVDADTNYTTSYIYPQALEEDFDETRPRVLFPLGFSSTYKFESYVIRIKNIPLNNFKTNAKKDQRGYKQAILATVPTPFSDTSVDTTITTSSTPYLGSAYEPHYPHIINLNNQKMTLNRFDIEITRLKDDSLAEDLYHSTINFSIIPPDE